MNSKLERQLKELLTAAVITSETAQKITKFYHAKQESKPNRLFTIFGVLGALLSGLGILLIIAHNWDDMQRSIKTILAFLPLLIGQIICAFSLIKNKSITWIESSATFLVFAVGATIALVSQIYNIPGNLGDFLLLWAAITAPLMYLLRSNFAVILHLVLATWYVCYSGYSYDGHKTWWFLVLFAWVVPYYVSLQKQKPETNIIGVLNWLLPLSLVAALGNLPGGNTLIIMQYLGLFGLLYNIGQLPFFENQKLRRNGFTLIGSLGSISLLMGLTFEWFWKDAAIDMYSTIDVLISLALFLAGIAVIAITYYKKQVLRFNLFQYAFLIIGAVYLTRSLGHIHAIIITNILVAALGLFAVRIGIQKNSYGVLNYGLLIITTLIICRFFDTNLDFVFRGILFLAVGVGFFFANYILLKKQSKAVHTNSNTKNHE